jgi:hypothetical protein
MQQMARQPHIEGTVYKFDDLQIAPGLMAFASGEANIEISCAGEPYIDRIALDRDATSGVRFLDGELAYCTDDLLKTLIKRALIRDHSTRIAEACRAAAERGTINALDPVEA